MVILVADRFDPSLARRLQEFGEVSEDLCHLGEAEALIVRGKTKCTAEFLAGAPKLKLIIRGGVGLDNIDLEAARKAGIRVLNTPRASAIAVAELTLSLMLAASTHLLEAHNSMAAGKWKKSELKRTELFGKRLALIGLGSIATEVAARAVAFGMRVSGIRKSERGHDIATVAATIEEAVTDADFVSLHVPLTEGTRGMIGKRVISHMKEGVVLVNTARAGCVVAQDVADALRTGRIRTYAADVWPDEPPDREYPLFNAPHVIMTPHIGANSSENLLRIGEEVYNAVNQYQRERP